jgi:hypothetical protein
VPAVLLQARTWWRGARIDDEPSQHAARVQTVLDQVLAWDRVSERLTFTWPTPPPLLASAFVFLSLSTLLISCYISNGTSTRTFGVLGLRGARCARQAGRTAVMRTARPNWASMSTKLGSNKGGSFKVDVSHLDHLVSLDEANWTLTCEPAANMGDVTNYLVPKGLALLCQVCVVVTPPPPHSPYSHNLACLILSLSL